ncbi:MAG: UDP-3-O-(3-hydroxymyristoyl)glucosamine N-acyltransferase [Pyrinomonadaceae bacterium]
MKTQEIADLVSGELIGDGSVEIERVASLDTAKVGEIAFVSGAGSAFTKASCLIAPNDFERISDIPLILVRDPKLAFAMVGEVLHPSKKRAPEIHPSAVLSDSATIGKGVFAGAFVCIGDNSLIGDGTQLRAGAKVGDRVTIGSNCFLGPNVLVDDRCTIGNNVLLQSGTVIGTDGFGYVRDSDRYVKFPQIGAVVIEDNVEIGGNCAIDRGSLGDTIIGEGTKIDNLVHIAHNVKIGKRVIIAGQSGIAGSSVIEDDVVIAGQVGISDHVVIKAGVTIGAKSAVYPNKVVRSGTWCGNPIVPIGDFKRQQAHLAMLERMRTQIRSLKTQIDEMKRD